MATERTITPELLADVGETIGLDLGAQADEFVDPVREIVSSMDVLRRAPSRPATAPAIEPVERPDPHNAFITRCVVQRTDSEGPLSGSRVALKDNVSLAGVPLTAGSGMLEGYVPSRSAPIAERLLDAGARIVGKANMDEFAFGPTGETSFFGPTENPRAPDHTPGGSSSGSAAAVAADEADLGIGTDTGGSVRIPASYCGVLGFKPTQGRIPTAGVVELAGSLDTVGVLGTTLEAIGTCTAVLAGDWSAPESLDGADPDDLTLGVPESQFDDPVRESVADHVAAVVDDVEAMGASTADVTLPSSTHTSAVWRAITMSELYRYVTDDALPYRLPGGEAPPFATAFRGARAADVDRLSEPLKWYLLIGGFLARRDGGRRYANAVALRRRFAEDVAASLESVDVLVTPSTPTTAFEFGEFSRDSSPPINNNTHLFNLSGNPAISVPCGTVDGLPVGVQIVGRRGADADVLRVARTVENAVSAG